MTDSTVEPGFAGHPASPSAPLNRRHPLHRAAAVGVVGIAVTASTFLGAGVAGAAEPVVVTDCTQWARSSEFGQPIIASPTSLDGKVRDATFLATLRTDRAEQAKQEFLSSGSVSLGSVTERNRFVSGPALADAFAGRVSNLSSVGDRADAVNGHLRALVLSCLGVTVPGQDRPAPPPPPPQRPEPQPSPSPSPSSRSAPPSEDSPSFASAPSGAYSAYPGYGAPAPVRMVPDYAYVPGSLPPWAQARYGQVPGFTPDVGNLLHQSAEQQREKAKRDEVQAAGKAEALPANTTKRVALPVLIAAISIAGVTAALVRTWVLRRT